ncbi:MAG: hypothetical protein KF914_03340 [Rhizobiaceae bacterium]|nr:hypothetical protein [Rhizobiaceae bacterium]
MIVCIPLALLAMLVVLLLEVSRLTDLLPNLFNAQGVSAAALLPFDLLLAVTIAFFVAALVASHTLLALVQAIFTVAYGVMLIVGGFLIAIAGAAKLVSLISLLLAFPFGTIAYFVKFNCTADALDGWGGILGGSCFDGTTALVLVAAAIKLASFLLLLIASVRFLQVVGLLVVTGVSLALSIGLAVGLWYGAELPFLLHPLDAVATIIFGLVSIGLGIVAFWQGLKALAFAIAAQLA